MTPQELRAAASDEDLDSFYAGREWRPIWSAERAQALAAALDEAERHGLSRDMFLRSSAAAGGIARREVALTRAALAYAEALATGKTDPRGIRSIYTVERPAFDARAGLAEAVHADRVREWLAGLAPSDGSYRALSEAYLRYRRSATGEQARNIALEGIIRPGERDERVPRIASALRSDGYLGERAAAKRAADGMAYTSELADAVRRLQEDYGIAVDGIVGPDTFRALNRGAADRARQLAVNLERLRWLERTPPSTRIDVNTAAAHLDYWRDGAHRDHRKVVVGQPGWETPQLGSPIFRLVANPTWTVPKSIEREELAGKSAAYLRRNNMVRRDGWIVQLPGPQNALGRVKLDMRNRHAIYLHDTPAKHLFERSDRHLSHGCVRVEDALGFARMIAGDDGKLGRFEEALASGERTFVGLDRNVPVRLLYHTSFVERSGRVVFRDDPYGWDDDVADALGLERRSRRAIRRHNSDIGP